VDNVYYPDVVDISNRVKEIVNTKNLGSPSRWWGADFGDKFNQIDYIQPR